MISELDETDQTILAARAARFNQFDGPRVGDFVIMPSGEMTRFTHDWGPDIQTASKIGWPGRFYLHDHGQLDYSGALDPAILKAKLVLRDQFEDGAAWFFHHNEARAHNGVNVTLRCRVYEYLGAA